MPFRDCIDTAAADGVITREEADELLRRFEAERAAAGGNDAAAKAALTERLKGEALQARRRQLLQVSVTQRIAEDVRAYRGPDGKPDIVSAVARLFENVGHTGYGSVRGRLNALLGGAMSEMGDLLHNFRRNWLKGGRRMNAPTLRSIVEAAHGGGSEEAQGFYRAWLKPAQKLRQLFNEAGGSIGWRDDWGLPMWHDPSAVMRGGFDRWREFLEPRLDWDRMAHASSGLPIAAAERSDVLRHVWESVVTDGWNTREPSARGGGSSLANRRQDARFLTFRDPAAWTDYNTQFGRGTVYDTMMDHVRGMSRDVALMQKLGPNPAATVQWLKQVISQEEAKYKAGSDSLYRTSWATRASETLSPGAVSKNAAGARRLIDSLYEFARGANVPHALVDKGLTVLLNVEAGAKLGSAVITHAAINPLLQGLARAHYGIPLGDMIGNVVKNIGREGEREALKAGLVMGDAMHSMEGGAREAGVVNGWVEKSAWLPALTTHVTGLEAGVNALRRSWYFSVSGAVARALDSDFADLEPRFKSLLTGFGIDDRDWAIMRLAERYEPSPGAQFLRFPEIRDAGLDKGEQVQAIIGRTGGADEAANVIAAANAAQETAWKFHEMLLQSMEFAVPSSRWRARAFMQFGTQQGTALNLLARSVGQFKGFLGSFTVSFLEALRHELAGNKYVGAAAAGGAAIAMTAMGMFVLQTKTVSNGKDLLPMDIGTPEGRATWARAFLQSGAMSVYGDFLASDRSSYGHGPLEELAGPAVGAAVDAYQAIRDTAGKAYRRATGTGKPSDDFDPGASVTKLLRNNTPLLSTAWFLRAAYNRVLLDQLQYLADPKAHQSMRKLERAVQKDTNQAYWWRPGDMLPSRAPQLTPGR